VAATPGLRLFELFVTAAAVAAAAAPDAAGGAGDPAAGAGVVAF
jgi:hypothetical protein